MYTTISNIGEFIGGKHDFKFSICFSDAFVFFTSVLKKNNRLNAHTEPFSMFQAL